MKTVPAFGHSKGIAIHAVALVVIFGFMLFLIFMVFGGYLDIQNCEVLNSVCDSKRLSYCTDWQWSSQTFEDSAKPEWTPTKACNEKGEVKENWCKEPSRSECQDFFQ
jgi:hypothetical protein